MIIGVSRRGVREVEVSPTQGAPQADRVNIESTNVQGAVITIRGRCKMALVGNLRTSENNKAQKNREKVRVIERGKVGSICRIGS